MPAWACGQEITVRVSGLQEKEKGWTFCGGFDTKIMEGLT